MSATCRSLILGCTVVDRSRDQTSVSLEKKSWTSTDDRGAIGPSLCVADPKSCPRNGAAPIVSCCQYPDHAKHTH